MAFLTQGALAGSFWDIYFYSEMGEPRPLYGYEDSEDLQSGGGQAEPPREAWTEVPETEEVASIIKIATIYNEAIQFGEKLNWEHLSEEEGAKQLEIGFDRVFKQFLELHQESYTEAYRNQVRGVKKWVSWKNYVRNFKRWKSFFRKNWKQKGAAYLYLFSITSLLKVVLPITLYEYGGLAWVTAWEVIPIKPIVFGTYAYWTYKQLQAMIYKIYGGKERYLELRDAEKEFFSQLNFDSSRDVLFSLSTANGFWKDIVISKPQWWDKFIVVRPFAGRSQAQGLTLNAVKQFCDEILATDDFLRAVWNDLSLNEYLKIEFSLQYLFMNPNPFRQFQFELRFSHRFRDLNNHLPWKPIVEWATEAQKAKNFSELRKALMKVPKGSDMRGVLLVLEKAILPYLARYSSIPRKNLKVLMGPEYYELLHLSETEFPTVNDLWLLRLESFMINAEHGRVCDINLSRQDGRVSDR